jgi:hypothetical protein
VGRLKLKLDLHDISNRDEHIDRALRAILDEAVAKKAPLVESWRSGDDDHRRVAGLDQARGR